MEPKVIFHRLVRRDIDGILTYYEQEAGSSVADRFFDGFLSTIAKALRDPHIFHPLSGNYRRANIPGFPYHFLYRETGDSIRILVLRHDRRDPQHGLRRK